MPARARYRRGPGSLYRRLKSIEFLLTRDRGGVARFLVGGGARALPGRVDLVRRFLAITNHTRGYHTLGEILLVADEVLRRRAPAVLEAGCAHGSSTGSPPCACMSEKSRHS